MVTLSPKHACVVGYSRKSGGWLSRRQIQRIISTQGIHFVTKMAVGRRIVFDLVGVTHGAYLAGPTIDPAHLVPMALVAR